MDQEDRLCVLGIGLANLTNKQQNSIFPWDVIIVPDNACRDFRRSKSGKEQEEPSETRRPPRLPSESP